MQVLWSSLLCQHARNLAVCRDTTVTYTSACGNNAKRVSFQEGALSSRHIQRDSVMHKYVLQGPKSE